MVCDRARVCVYRCELFVSLYAICRMHLVSRALPLLRRKGHSDLLSFAELDSAMSERAWRGNEARLAVNLCPQLGRSLHYYVDDYPLGHLRIEWPRLTWRWFDSNTPRMFDVYARCPWRKDSSIVVNTILGRLTSPYIIWSEKAL